MNEHKELFVNVIKNDKIDNERARDFALYCINYIPDYFWTIPASSSGKYHSVTDLGAGGLVRHSLMVYRIAIDLLNINTIEIISKFKNEILLACLFHDCCKNGFENSGHTEHEHPIFAATLMERCYKDFIKTYPTTTTNNENLYISIITSAIRTHMGKWTTSKYSEIILPKPASLIQKFVHKCDCIASRKYCLFDNDYFNDFVC